MNTQWFTRFTNSIRPLYHWIHNRLDTNRKLKYQYLKFSTFLATHGVCPPLSPRAVSSTERWQKQGTGDNFPTPETYVQEDNSVVELFKEVLPYLDKNSRILEIGCNVGRSLNYLHSQGYRNLTGIEIGNKAIDLMKVEFPAMYGTSTIIIGDVTEAVRKLDTDAYDLVFCHSVLVNIHPKYNFIFDEIARISRKFILILENEGSYISYPRDFKKMFEKRGYKMIVSKLFSGGCSSLPVLFNDIDIYKNNTIRLFVKNASASR